VHKPCWLVPRFALRDDIRSQFFGSNLSDAHGRAPLSTTNSGYSGMARCLFALTILASISVATQPVKAVDEKAVPKDHAERVKKGLVLFQEGVRATLTKHCLDCHGGKSTKADFDLSSRKALLEGGYSFQKRPSNRSSSGSNSAPPTTNLLLRKQRLRNQPRWSSRMKIGSSGRFSR